MSFSKEDSSVTEIVENDSKLSERLRPNKDSFTVDSVDGDDSSSGRDVQSLKSKKWTHLKPKERLKLVSFSILKAIVLIVSLYFFICSLHVLSVGFRIVGGRTTGNLFKQGAILGNQIVGVMIGLLVTVLVQSSSTTTTILVGLVSSKIMTVKVAIPFVMGANVGTSITNAIVSLGQIGNRHQFKLAFAGACLHDAFNVSSLIVLLTIESFTDFLYNLTRLIVDISRRNKETDKVEIFSRLTKPLVNSIVKLKKDDEIFCIGSGSCSNGDNSTVIKSTGIFPKTWSDKAIGSLILIAAVIVLFLCLMITVKVLKSILQGKLAKIVKRTVNANIPYVPWLSGYIALLVGMSMTFLLQSSSVFTSAMTPLIGIGVISIDRAYPLTLGSNVGTCITAILASLAVPGPSFYPAFQIALCHLFFNLVGILIFYPIPFMRFPVDIAKFIGRETSKYRWFAIAYMTILFFLLPLFILGLSIAGSVYVIVVVSLFCIICLLIAIVNILQTKRPKFLPKVMRTWEWLPLPLRSLKPYDDFFGKFRICRLVKKYSDPIIEQTNSHYDEIDGTAEQNVQNYNKLIDESGDQQNADSHIEEISDENKVVQQK